MVMSGSSSGQRQEVKILPVTVGSRPQMASPRMRHCRTPLVGVAVLRRRALFAAIAIPLGSVLEVAVGSPRKHVDLTISSDGDLLAFKPDRLTCPAGASIHLTFFHTGKYVSQDHNWVLTLPGAADAVAQAALAAGEKSGWLPKATDASWLRHPCAHGGST